MNTDLSCAPPTRLHLGTDVLFHYVPKLTVFHVFLKIAIHWKELSSSDSLQKRSRNNLIHNGGWQFDPTLQLRYQLNSEKLQKNDFTLLLFSRQVLHGFSPNFIV